ncbi:hypothetical protein ACH4GG_23900 [Streptomyces albidoflavus]|uniref:hypothetical protein n=1 Tax=Streptomyces albidoflavus TaxID=1886 RepID=UPI000B27C6AE|nr:hypothetical protein [Streptomyces albidoflavus]RZE28286.1 hypothetical protein C0Q96_12720 [Streptomyces albidoflavus]
MPYSFLLRLLPTETPPHLYRATVHNADGTHEAFLLLTPDPPSVHLADARGNPSGGLRMSLADGTVERTDAEPQEAHPALTTEDFMTVAAHLLAQHRRQGRPPGEVCRVFA